MKKSYKLFAIVAVVTFVAVLSLFAQQKGEETAKDPVCGMDVRIDGAKLTSEFQGKTYYFCSEICRKEFLKDPAKYTAPAAEAPKAGVMEEGCEGHQGCCRMMEKAMMMHLHMGRHHGMHMGRGREFMGMMMGHGMASDCPMCGMESAGLETTVENTKDGVIVRITAKDPEKVKMIQEKWAQKKAACDPARCPMKKKAEAENKETEKK